MQTMKPRAEEYGIENFQLASPVIGKPSHKCPLSETKTENKKGINKKER